MTGGSAWPVSQEHGGTDALGTAAHDFSTNSNACGPCPEALQAVQAAEVRHYPDPHYTALREALAAWHGVAPWQILLAASASECIHRLSLWALRRGAEQVVVPSPCYGDYARQAQALGLTVASAPATREPPPEHDFGALRWACQPSSPAGRADPQLAPWLAAADAQAWRAHTPDALPAPLLRVLDMAYAPLVLDGGSGAGLDWLQQAAGQRHACWQLFSPNKALGMTGVRGAYAIAPCPPPGQSSSDAGAMAERAVAELQALAPSWPLGVHGVAMLQAWQRPSVQQWLAHSRQILLGWKRQQQACCEALGWQVWPGSLANYFVAAVPQAGRPDWPALLQSLRTAGIKLRDTTSMGLPGHVRLGVRPPASQQALRAAWQSLPAAMR
ncbi:aminotransferase class I/II-fold pyridoxal phosphate-dependent enzyme [Corticibacter populi]|uniref:histidinol-phosphate transaminase n=1 Tax=Corticibacter populi TaxID=1550736 RepID=A0A3M6QTI2_9BURK|nr:aminotransferase class I/II-fold pyridoxal phosphate-dependent enzyme [Corticibacter populi]RMX06336.1 aminotransferase class I/II-fold pyridoxal phosphate-dependent enzyme [Corticibacter populi]RZS32124.1 histidinol-phosphate aminotransferase [Corticibacter populi]